MEEKILKRFKHQEGEKGQYEEIGKQIGRAIDRFIASHYFDRRTEGSRDKEVASGALDASVAAIRIGQSLPKPSLNGNDSWTTIIALIDTAKDRFDQCDIPARLLKIDQKQEEAEAARADYLNNLQKTRTDNR
jgi:hypothetical protein